jgi:predicted nuclease of predicted toxin-antitoxin system
VKFLVDMALSPDLAIWLRSQGHDAAHAAELALNRAADTEILSTALDAGRVVISADLDFPRLLALAGATCPGLILLRSGNYSEAESLECVRRVLMSVPAEDLPRSIVVVDHKSVRRRLLPI